MKKKYVTTAFVSTLFLAGATFGCRESREAPSPARGPAASPAERPEEPPGAALPAPPEGPRHAANGISFAELVDGAYEDDLVEGIASSRASYPAGIAFAVISSPAVVPTEQAREIQVANARRAAAMRGQIVEEADAPGRPFAEGELEGHRIVYETAEATMHTEIFALEQGGRTVIVFIEFPDPPDQLRDVIDALTTSLRVTAP